MHARWRVAVWSQLEQGWGSVLSKRFTYTRARELLAQYEARGTRARLVEDGDMAWPDAEPGVLRERKNTRWR